MLQVIYLTGAPATGKSTLIDYLKKNVKSLKVFSYSSELINYINNKNSRMYSHRLLRKKSSSIVTTKDIIAVDNKLITFVKMYRNKYNIIIDSHAVTKEKFGFRITPFSYNLLTQLALTQIYLLYLDPKSNILRIKENPKGRLTINQFESSFHTFMQTSVALNYTMQLGKPLYLLNSNTKVEVLGNEIISRL